MNSDAGSVLIQLRDAALSPESSRAADFFNRLDSIMGGSHTALSIFVCVVVSI